MNSASFSPSRAGYKPSRSPAPDSVHSHFAFALRVVRDHRARGFQDILGGAVILLQTDDRGVRKVLLEIENVVDVRAAPAVDRLVFVAHHADIIVLGR